MSEKEKNRGNTEKLLYQSLESIIIQDGFEKLGINLIAKNAGVAKVLIYRYFDSLDNMILQYLSKQDFWINFSLNLPNQDNIIEYVKTLFKEQIDDLRNNKISARLLRWELNENNNTLEKLRLKRESKSITLITIISQFSGRTQEEISSLFIILTSTINYLIILKDTCPIFNGIDLQSEQGWIYIHSVIDNVIDKWFYK